MADFSGCPEVLGLSSVDADLLLADTELCDDAMEYVYPDIIREVSSNYVLRRRKPQVTNKSVPKITESNDAGLTSSMENSITDFSLPPTDMFNSKEVSSSTPVTQVDADAMFREIIKVILITEVKMKLC